MARHISLTRCKVEEMVEQSGGGGRQLKLGVGGQILNIFLQHSCVRCSTGQLILLRGFEIAKLKQALLHSVYRQPQD